jgi:hypothetical protein
MHPLHHRTYTLAFKLQVIRVCFVKRFSPLSSRKIPHGGGGEFCGVTGADRVTALS